MIPRVTVQQKLVLEIPGPNYGTAHKNLQKHLFPKNLLKEMPDSEK
jgi:hypothetical protein